MSYGSSEWQSWVLNEKDALPLLKHAYDKGINTWDTVWRSGVIQFLYMRWSANYSRDRLTSTLMAVPKRSLVNSFGRNRSLVTVSLL